MENDQNIQIDHLLRLQILVLSFDFDNLVQKVLNVNEKQKVRQMILNNSVNQNIIDRLVKMAEWLKKVGHNEYYNQIMSDLGINQKDEHLVEYRIDSIDLFNEKYDDQGKEMNAQTKRILKNIENNRKVDNDADLQSQSLSFNQKSYR